MTPIMLVPRFSKFTLLGKYVGLLKGKLICHYFHLTLGFLIITSKLKIILVSGHSPLLSMLKLIIRRFLILCSGFAHMTLGFSLFLDWVSRQVSINTSCTIVFQKWIGSNKYKCKPDICSFSGISWPLLYHFLAFSISLWASPLSHLLSHFSLPFQNIWSFSWTVFEHIDKLSGLIFRTYTCSIFVCICLHLYSLSFFLAFIQEKKPDGEVWLVG